MRRKGFPESYDLERMLVFLAELKEGKSELRVPVYSHELYDIVPGQFQTINQPQVLILEGLNVLQGVSSSLPPVLFLFKGVLNCRLGPLADDCRQVGADVLQLIKAHGLGAKREGVSRGPPQHVDNSPRHAIGKL